MKNKRNMAIMLLATSLLAACSGTGYNNKTTGTAGGAAGGALVGQMIGKNTKGTLIGAGIGALAGLGWGAYKDAQYKEFMEALSRTDVTVTNNENSINLRLPGSSSFATGSAVINNNFYGPLNSIADVMKRYPETKIQVSGYTDNTGNPNVNLNLSLERAQSVANYFAAQGIATNRISTVGYGDRNPIASNATEAGRAMNRRVEIEIVQK